MKSDIDLRYIEYTLNLRQEIYDESPNNPETINKIKVIDEMFENFMLDYNIVIHVSINDNKHDIMKIIIDKIKAAKTDSDDC